MTYYINSIIAYNNNQKAYYDYVISVGFKNIKTNNFKISELYVNPLEIKYPYYFSKMQQLDSYSGYEINYYYKLNKNNYYSKYTDLFNINDNIKYRRNRNNIKLLNVIQEHTKNIESRKVSNNLANPHYFFTHRYNEKTMASQIKQWTSSVFNFLKNEKTGNNFKDIYTSDFLKLFFNVHSGRRKHSLLFNFLNPMKMKVNPFLMMKVNEMIKYMSNRSRLAVRKLTTFPSQILTLDWAVKQIQFSHLYKKLNNTIRSEYADGYSPKRKDYIKNFNKILISRPLFKHTSFNLVIDLFVFNNKRNKIKKMYHITLRRTMYKYMYSMYVNCYEKINDTINRPRFFYINLIEPKIHKYYDWVLKHYGELIIIKKKPVLILLFLYLLQVNFIKKIKLTNINNLVNNNIFKNKPQDNNNNNINIDSSSLVNINNIDSTSLLNNLGENNKKIHSLVFKRRTIYSKFNKYNNLFIKEYKELYNLNKENKENKEINYESNITKLKKNANKSKRMNYNKYKNYLAELDRKSNTPIDINKLSLWNSKGLGKQYRTPRGIVNDYNNFSKKSNFKGYNKNKSKKKNLMYNNDNVLYNKEKGVKKNSDLWYKRRNKVNPWNVILNNQSKNKYNYNNPWWDKKKPVFNSPIFESQKRETHINDNNDLIITGIDKQEYINEIKKEMKNSSLINNSFTSFYFKNNNPKNNINQNNSFLISELKNKISVGVKLNKSRSKNINKYNLVENNIIGNSKLLWDKMDHSILSVLSNQLEIRKDLFSGSSISQLSSLFNEVKKFKGFGNVWYLMYFLSIIKKEFNNVNRDILVLKKTNLRPYLINKSNNVLIEEENEILRGIGKFTGFKINLFSSFMPTDRENNLNMKWSYYDKIFKPYYRSMIPLFILNTFITLHRYTGNYNPISYIFKFLDNKLNHIQYSWLDLYNYITVKILLDLLHYNYRSWIRIKPKYYYLRKVKINRKKLHSLTIKNWVTSIRLFKKLKKTPKNFWVRYHKNASNFMERIVTNSELDTKRKIFVPFVLYVEDVLYSIYGKWVIIRLWPLKYYYLSSYMLANRVLMLLLLREKQKKQQRNKFRFTLSKFSLKLITLVKSFEIKKAYDYYIYNSSAWPNALISKMNYNNKPYSLNYKNLEFFNEKEERFHYNNSYTLMYNNLSDFLPIYNNKYKSIVRYYMNCVKNIKTKKKFNKRRGLLFNYNKYKLMYYWLLPLKTYIMDIMKSTDITGMKWKLSGRPTWRRSNDRKVNKIFNYGNRLIPQHMNPKTYEKFSLFTPRLRGYLRSHIESSTSVSKSRNGAVSLKVWIASILSVDVHELLLHLVRIKGLYNQLINRYYIQRKTLLSDKLINLKGNMNNRKKELIWISKWIKKPQQKNTSKKKRNKLPLAKSWNLLKKDYQEIKN